MDPSDERTPRIDEHPGDGAVRGTQRMEIFADAVFAIAFTLPIVELTLPEGGPGFGERLIGLWPSYLEYALSALVIGIYWVQHHFSGAIYRTTGHRFLVATILFLATIGFIAFPTRAFTEHLHDPEARISGAIFYPWALTATSLGWLLKWETGRATGDVDARLEPAYVARLTLKYRLTSALMLVAAAISLFNWAIGLALAGVITLYFVRAPETPVYQAQAPKADGVE